MFCLFVCFFLFQPQAANQSTVSIYATPTCTVRSHGALVSARRLIDMAVSHANTILEEIIGKLLSDVQPDLEKLKKQLCPWISATFKEPYLRRRFIYIDELISSFKRRLSNLLLRLLYFWFSSGFKKLRPRCKFKMLFPS